MGIEEYVWQLEQELNTLKQAFSNFAAQLKDAHSFADVQILAGMALNDLHGMDPEDGS